MKPLSKSKSRDKPLLSITPGEPAGIGPDICILGHEQASQHADLIYYADIDLLARRMKNLALNIEINDLSCAQFRTGAMNVRSIPLIAQVIPGQPNPDNGPYVIETLSHALQDCTAKVTDALVTGPVNKAVICDGGLPFTGHTEWLAEHTGTQRVVMMLAGGGMRVALATTHLPLSQVSDAINEEMLIETLRITRTDLINKFSIPDPHILVCGLNPHAGEGGHLGMEEINVITPAIEALQKQGYRLTGPLPADTAFTQKHLSSTDCVLAMFHDQGLPVLKHAAFGNAVNVTLGLPIIRTSVDHGTAFDIAGTGKADCSSLLAAIDLAAELVT
jgi:4-hydroxythreonine-4-phosphate dehydrogenase